MRMILPFLVSGFAVLLVGVVAYECKAQTNTPESNNRLITLGTVAGPPPRPLAWAVGVAFALFMTSTNTSIALGPWARASSLTATSDFGRPVGLPLWPFWKGRPRPGMLLPGC